MKLHNPHNKTHKMELKNPQAELMSLKDPLNSQKTPVNITDETDDSLSVSFDVNSIPTDTYDMKVELVFTKKNSKTVRIMQTSSNDIPDNFILTYKPNYQLFIGNDEEVAKQAEALNKNQNSVEKDNFDTKLFAIVFPIVIVVIFIIFLGIYCKYMRKLKKNKILSSITFDGNSPAGTTMAKLTVVSPTHDIKIEDLDNLESKIEELKSIVNSSHNYKENSNKINKIEI